MRRAEAELTASSSAISACEWSCSYNWWGIDFKLQWQNLTLEISHLCLEIERKVVISNLSRCINVVSLQGTPHP
jgi:hypothetical protein